MMEVKPAAELLKEARVLNLAEERESYRGQDIWTAIDGGKIVTFSGEYAIYDSAKEFILKKLCFAVATDQTCEFMKKINYGVGTDAAEEMLGEFVDSLEDKSENDQFWQERAEEGYEAEYMGEI